MPLVPTASPLYTAPAAELSTAINPWLLMGGTLGFQPTIVPFSVANRKKAGPECPLSSEITNSDVLLLKTLKTTHVGNPPGMLTSSTAFEKVLPLTPPR